VLLVFSELLVDFFEAFIPRLIALTKQIFLSSSAALLRQRVKAALVLLTQNFSRFDRLRAAIRN